jgi:hypothetical protein
VVRRQPHDWPAERSTLSAAEAEAALKGLDRLLVEWGGEA